MLSLLGMMGNYEMRKVSYTRTKTYELDTAMVTDRSWRYETAVRVPGYRNGCWIIIDSADTKEDAETIHNKWAEILDKQIPESFYDIYEDEAYAKTNKILQ